MILPKANECVIKNKLWKSICNQKECLDLPTTSTQLHDIFIEPLYHIRLGGLVQYI